jgi:hypothetical protein
MEGDFDDENTILKDAAHSTRDKHGCNNKAEQLVFRYRSILSLGATMLRLFPSRLNYLSNFTLVSPADRWRRIPSISSNTRLV